MKGLYIDDEVFGYLSISIKNRIVSSIEEKTKDWKYLLMVSEFKKLALEKYQVKLNINDLDSSIIDLLLKEFESNMK